MNVLFVHDHKFKKYGVNYFSEGKITNEVFNRYINEDERLVVISRMERCDNSNGLNKIDSSNVFFKPVRGLELSTVLSKYFFSNSKSIIEEIQKSDFIVIRLPSFLGVYTLLLNILIRKKYFIELVGDPQDALITSKDGVSLLFKSFAYSFSYLNGYFIKRASGVIYVTQTSLQKKYATLGLSSYASNIEISILEKSIVESYYAYKSDVFKIGLIGSFNNHYKGIKEAISAISHLKHNEQKMELHILGSGKLKEDYIMLASNLGVKDSVFFDGVLKGGKDVVDWLSSLDLYIQPSYTEGLPRALIEAMSVGLPAVATDVGGIPELLPNVALIKPYDSKALAQKMKAFINSQSLRFEHGKLNYEKSKEYDNEILKQRRSQFWKAAREIVKKNIC